MRLLVVGGAGFIGSNFVRMVAERYPDYELEVFDALTYAGTLEPLEALRAAGRVDFVHADVCDRHTVQEAVSKSNAVVNFAAHSHVDRSIQTTRPFHDVNAGGVINILDSLKALERGGDRHRRFVQVSTDEVAGEAPAGVWFTEEDRQMPSNPYSASKAAADGYVSAYVRTFGIDACVTRCTNNYGPWQYPEKLVAMVVTSLIDGRKVPVHGDGRMTRDWIWVEDHCDAIDRVLHRGERGQVYNVAGLCERSVLDVVGQVAAAFGRRLEDVVERIEDRPGQDRRYAVSPAKAMSALGWRPGKSFEERLPELVSWYREHESWWRRIMGTDHYREHFKMLRRGQ